MLKEESNIARKALLNETFMGLKGLIHECRELTEMMGIPDIMTNLVRHVGLTPLCDSFIPAVS